VKFVTNKRKNGGRNMKYDIGIDIGVASTGLAVVDEEGRVLEATSSLYTEADAAANVKRRDFRDGRRTKRRKHTRIEDFKNLWSDCGYIIPDKLDNNVIELRNRGIVEKISMDQLYAVLLSMLKHRGISYLDDAIDEAKGSNYAKGIALNQKELKNKLPCEIQAKRLEKYGKYRGDSTVKNGEEEEYHSNVFTTSAYRKELDKLLDTQIQFALGITSEFKEEYMKIFSRKREYYIGPGNEKSRTDYGIYTTRKDEDGKYVTEKNIFEKLIGKCSIYPDELRAAGASYSAQEFNVLNDLNNLTVNNRKLSEEEKRKIVATIKESNMVNMRSIIRKIIKEDIEQFSGARIDKKEKEIYHTFEVYRKMKKSFDAINIDINAFSREELDEFGRILTLNTEKAGIIKAFEATNQKYSDEVINVLVDLRKKNSSLFSKWHSFSLKAMIRLIPDMYVQSKEQMQLLTEMGVLKQKPSKYNDYKYIPVEKVIEEIYNPVVVRSIRTTVKMINEVIRKYGYPENIIIEMPRDKNSAEEKKKINEAQAKNEKEYEYILKKIQDEYGIEIIKADYRRQEKLPLKLKLWNEQNGKCLYSGRPISVESILNNPQLFEIDHIIPKSISFDDSRNNKVLVYRSENQEKGNQTPYMYLSRLNREWNFDSYKKYVLEMKKNNGISNKKVQNLLFMDDINKIDVLKGFISRNINDTRYASRVVLNELQAFFKAKENCTTKIKVIRGSFTHQMRVNLRLEKNRDESYSHHAVDAMLIVFSQRGYDAYRKLQETYMDFETGEILNEQKWKECLDEDKYDQILYEAKWSKIREEIQEAEKHVKYHYRVDKKCNRGLCNQTIYGTRTKNGEQYKICSFDIYNDKECKNLQKMIKAGKESDILMYHNDPKTYKDMLKIIKEYSSEKNPFVAYNKETGDYFRKYSKKHNGPKIEKIKYYKEKVVSCIDISHKYGHEKGSKKVILGSLNPYRTDVFVNKTTGEYYLVGIKYNHIKCKGDLYIIDEESYNKLLINAGAIKNGETLKDLERLNVSYRFSLYKNDIIQYEKNGKFYTERFLSRTKEQNKNYIETKPIEKPFFQKEGKNGEMENKQSLVGLGKTKFVGKLVTDVLGNVYEVKQEKFSLVIDN